MENVSTIDQIVVSAIGVVSCREKIVINGIDARYHRHNLSPGADLTQISSPVRDICVLAWTPEIVAVYAAATASPPPTREQLLAKIEQAITSHIISVAVADGWDNQITCMLRASYPNPWQAKGIAYATWVDNCWLHTLTEKDKILAGIRTIPTPEAAVLELPVMVWPV